MRNQRDGNAGRSDSGCTIYLVLPFDQWDRCRGTQPAAASSLWFPFAGNKVPHQRDGSAGGVGRVQFSSLWFPSAGRTKETAVQAEHTAAASSLWFPFAGRPKEMAVQTEYSFHLFDFRPQAASGRRSAGYPRTCSARWPPAGSRSAAGSRPWPGATPHGTNPCRAPQRRHPM